MLVAGALSIVYSGQPKRWGALVAIRDLHHLGDARDLHHLGDAQLYSVTTQEDLLISNI